MVLLKKIAFFKFHHYHKILWNIYSNRLLGRFAPIFYFNCKRVLIVNIEKQRKKEFRGFQDIKIFKNIKTFKHKFFKFWQFINLPWGDVRSHTKFGPDRFCRFDVYWIQTDRQTSQIYIPYVHLNIFWKGYNNRSLGLNLMWNTTLKIYFVNLSFNCFSVIKKIELWNYKFKK